MDAQYWRIKSVTISARRTSEWWGMTWAEVEKHLALWREGGFVLVPMDMKEPHMQYNLETHDQRYNSTVEIKPDTEYVPDLVVEFFGGKRGG